MSIERVDDGSLSLRCFGKISKEAANSFNLVPFGLLVLLVLDPCHQLTKDDEIDDDSSGKQTVLTDIVADESVFSAHKDLACVLINGLFGVSGVWHVLDNNCVIWLILGVSGVVKQRIVEDVLDTL